MNKLKNIILGVLLLLAVYLIDREVSKVPPDTPLSQKGRYILLGAVLVIAVNLYLALTMR